MFFFFFSGREEYVIFERRYGVVGCFWGYKVFVYQVMEDLVYGVVFGIFAWYVGVFELVFFFGRYVLVVWFQSVILVVFGVGSKQF